jgi:hypothetical protein
MRSCCRAGWSSTSGRKAKRSGAARERCGDACTQAGGPVVLGKVAQDFASRADLVFWCFGSWVAPPPFLTSAHERVGEQFARCVGGRGVAPTGDTPRDAAETTPEALSSSPATNAAGVIHLRPPCGRLWL